MKIAIVATGGVGGYFGARLAAAGEDVHFIACGQHLAALRANGLVLKSANGDLHLQSVSATDDPASIGTVDIVIFAVKQYDTESAARLIKPALGADTAAITLQNGMDKDEWRRAVLGDGHVMDGAAYIADAKVASPGVITHVGKVARIVFGEADGSRSARGERFLAACKNAGIEATFSTEIAKELWAKFALLSAWTGVSSVLPSRWAKLPAMTASASCSRTPSRSPSRSPRPKESISATITWRNSGTSSTRCPRKPNRRCRWTSNAAATSNSTGCRALWRALAMNWACRRPSITLSMRR
jgi:2-dehydropantoate 2-reductase